MHIKLIWFSVHAVLMMVLAMMMMTMTMTMLMMMMGIPRSVDIGHARALAIEVAHTDKEEGGD